MKKFKGGRLFLGVWIILLLAIITPYIIPVQWASTLVLKKIYNKELPITTELSFEDLSNNPIWNAISSEITCSAKSMALLSEGKAYGEVDIKLQGLNKDMLALDYMVNGNQFFLSSHNLDSTYVIEMQKSMSEVMSTANNLAFLKPIRSTYEKVVVKEPMEFTCWARRLEYIITQNDKTYEITVLYIPYLGIQRLEVQITIPNQMQLVSTHYFHDIELKGWDINVDQARDLSDKNEILFLLLDLLMK